MSLKFESKLIKINQITGSVILMLAQLVWSSVSFAENYAPRIAEQDWILRADLPPEKQNRLEPYCSGDYVEPPYGFMDSTSDELGILRAESEDAHLDEQDMIQLRGGVQLQQGPWWLEAEEVDIDKARNKAEVRKNIKARTKGLLMRGDTARLDLQTQDFSLDNSSYLIHERHARGAAEKITSVGRREITIVEGSYTTCTPFSNAWSFEASEIFLDREKGEGVATSMWLEIKDVPVLYFPYLVFPIDDRRRSGFLFPTLGNSSGGSGLDIGVPYYFNLAENYDATLAPRYLHGRGLLTEAEGRLLTENTYTEVRAGYISHDSEYTRDEPSQDGDRWALDIVNQADLGSRWYSDLDYNVVSDDDYLGDLNRTLEIQQESHIKRYWTLNHKTGHFVFNSRMQGYQTIDDDIDPEDQPYSVLPQINIAWDTPLSALDFGFRSELSSFWRDNSGLEEVDKSQGMRWRTEPDLSLNLQSTWGFFKPGFRIDHTDYGLYEQPEGVADHISRTVPFFRLDTGIYLDRQTSLFGNNLVQSLEPRLFYVYSPEVDQNDIPLFDASVPRFDYSRLFREDRFTGGDRVGDNHQVSLGLQTRFRQQESGLEVFRAGIGKIFYLQSGDVFLVSDDSDEDGRIYKKESPYAADLLWRPNSRVEFSLNGVWDEQDSNTQSGATMASFHNDDYSTLFNIGHRYRNDISDSLEQTDVALLFPLTNRVNMFGRWLYDLRDKRTIGSMLGMEYNSCCWRLQFMAHALLEDEDDDDDEDAEEGDISKGFLVRFQLRGLGAFNSGGDAASVLRNEVRNMDERSLYREERYLW